MDLDRKAIRIALRTVEEQLRKKVSVAMLEYGATLVEHAAWRVNKEENAFFEHEQSIDSSLEKVLEICIENLDEFLALKNSEDLDSIIDAAAGYLNTITQGLHECIEEPESTTVEIRGFGDRR